MGCLLPVLIFIGLPLLSGVDSEAAFVILAGLCLVWVLQKNPGIFRNSFPAKRPVPGHGVDELLILRLELHRLNTAGEIEPDRYAALCSELDQLWATRLTWQGVTPGDATWNERRTAAWQALQQFAGRPLGLPPWCMEIAPVAEPAEATQPPVDQGWNEPVATAVPAALST